MKCPKCGAGLTSTGSDKYYCKYCDLNITPAQANCKSLDQFMEGHNEPRPD